MSKNEKINKIGVLTSGGDAPGMNAAIRAVVRTASYFGIECMGIKEGYNGLINGDLIPMGTRSVKHIIHRGGTVLKTARSEEFHTAEGRKFAYETYARHQLDGLVCIGGDGTFTGANIFYQEYGIPIIGVPGTIDNDIYGTDATIGYDTALNTAMEAIDKIRDTATSHNRVFFIEVMGRDAGFIAINSGIAVGALNILVPEREDSIEGLFDTFEKAHNAAKSSNIVVVAEGEKIASTYELAAMTSKRFPHYEVRVSILGHIQRGGTPTCADRVLASRLGYGAVMGLREGKSNVMVGIQANKLAYTPFAEAISKHHEINQDLFKLAEILSM